MPKLNTTQMQFVFYAIGGLMAIMQPISFGLIAILMIVLGRKNLFYKSTPSPSGQ
jgi:hypothetical protein